VREREREREWKRERVLRFYIRAGRSVTGPIIYPRSFLVSNFHHRLPRPSLQPTLHRWRSLLARHRCLLISVKMFSLHSQVKLKFSPSFAVHPCVPKFFQTLFKIRISISPRLAVLLPSNPPPPCARWPAVFLTNSFLLAIMHASYIHIHAPRRFNRVCKYDV